jgi:hypothetical protein
MKIEGAPKPGLPSTIKEVQGEEELAGNTKEFLKTREFAKKAYENGRRAILAAVLSLSLFQNPASVEKTSRENSITAGHIDNLSGTLGKIFTPEQMEEYEESPVPLPGFLHDSFVQKKLIELDALFDISPENIREISENGEEFFLLITNTGAWEAIKKIRKNFPEGHKPGLDFLPLNNLDMLRNPKYVKGLEILAKIKMSEKRRYDFTEQIIRIADNPEAQKTLERLSSLGAQLDFSVLILTEFTAGHENELDVKTLNDFMDKNPNRNLLKNSKNAIGGLGLNELINDETGYWNNFFSNPKNKKGIEKLYSAGCDLSFILGLGREYVENIKDPDFLEIVSRLKILSEIGLLTLHEDSLFGGNEVSVMLECLSPYYDFKSGVGFKELREDLKNLSFTGDEPLSLEEVLMQPSISPQKEAVSNIFENLNRMVSPEDRNIEKFLQDPALSLVYRLGYQNKDNLPSFIKNFDNRGQVECVMWVARNMYVQGLTATPENFEKVFNETMKARLNPELLEESLFAGRNIAFFADNEKWKANNDRILTEDRFGTETAFRKINEQKPAQCILFKAEQDKESLKKVKEDFLSFISSKKNLTIVIDAHGSPTEISLTNGSFEESTGRTAEDKKNESVNYLELASALERRFDNGHVGTPILLGTNCFSQNFIRNLYGELIRINKEKKKNIPLPIACGTSEYGQPGFSSYPEEKPAGEYGNQFFYALFHGKERKKVKHLIELGVSDKTSSNVSVFIPPGKVENKKNNNKISKKTFYFQIAKKQSTLDKIHEMFHPEEEA